MTENKKRIYLINVTCGFGSTGRIVTGIYDELTRRGHICRAAYGRGMAPEGYSSYRIGSDFDVNVHGVLSRITDRHGFYSAAATKALIEDIKSFGAHVVHLHNIHGYYLNIKLLFEFLRASDIDVIWTLHDCWSFTGHCTHFEFEGCDKWLKGCHNCTQLREYPKSLLMDASEKNYREKKSLFTGMKNMRLVTPSKWLSEQVKRSYMNEYQVSVVPTGINLEVFKHRDSHFREKYGLKDKFVILGVANPWRERKGLTDFIRLREAMPDSYAIVLLGLKKDQAVKMPENIIALGRTDSIDEMAQWYSAADVYVNLTLEDTFPTTNIESLACGTPVVTYKAGGSGESIEKDCGYIVPRCDIEAVIEAVKSVERGECSSEKCRQRAAEYSLEKRFRQYFEDVYAQIL